MTTSPLPVGDSDTGVAGGRRPEPSGDDGSTVWVEACPIDRILPDTGVCVLVAGTQVAVFRLLCGEVFAVGNLDPFSDAAVLSRGIIGDRGGIPKVASPIYKQSFDLRSGRCLDDEHVRIPVFRTRVTDGIVYVCASPTDHDPTCGTT